MSLEALGDHPFLRGLSPGQLQSLASCARPVRYAEDAYILREGDAADTLYLLSSGCVTLEEHSPSQGVVAVESLCAGDILGLSWMFPSGRWMLDARCTGPVQGMALNAAGVRDRMERDPQLAVELLGRLVQALYQRLVRVRLQRLDVYRTET